MLQDTFPDIRDETWKFVSADMRMGVNQYGRVSPELNELMEDLPVVTAF